MEDIGVVGFEEGQVWLPTHVLDDALEPKELFTSQQHEARHRDVVDHSLPTSPIPRVKSKTHQRPRFRSNRTTSGGPGMQAIFLDSSKKSCGTGFFLPQKMGNHSQLNKKPACSPVLLPARVVQALNLNVHALGPQISPKKDPDNHLKGEIETSNCKKNQNNDLEPQSCLTLNTHHEEIFLPKEWTY